MHYVFSSAVSSLANNWEMFLRIFISVICGGIIGFERSKRQKEAGLRTHIIVAAGAALIMIISKYGCLDIFTTYGINVDSTRIASNIVTGVGFLGAGVIFVRGASIKGLTTAAGIWTTAGVGMAIGTGMYSVGIYSTLLITLVQYALHKWTPISSSETLTTNEITVTLANTKDSLNDLLAYFESNHIYIHNFGISKNNDNNTITLKLSVRMLREATIQESIHIFNEIPEVLSFKINY